MNVEQNPQAESPLSEQPSSEGAASQDPRAREEQAPAADESQKKRTRALRIALVAALVAVAVLLLLLLRTCSSEETGIRDPNAALGQLEGKSAEEIQAELDRIVEEGMFNVSISGVVEFADGTSEGALRIENVPANHYLMQVDITREDTGELVYRTDFIDPNHHIQTDTLDVDLDAGEYPCTATFYAHDPDTEELVGQAAVKLTIKVLG